MTLNNTNYSGTLFHEWGIFRNHALFDRAHPYILSQLLIEIQTSDINQNVPKMHVYISVINILKASET